MVLPLEVSVYLFLHSLSLLGSDHFGRPFGLHYRCVDISRQHSCIDKLGEFWTCHNSIDNSKFFPVNCLLTLMKLDSWPFLEVSRWGWGPAVSHSYCCLSFLLKSSCLSGWDPGVLDTMTWAERRTIIVKTWHDHLAKSFSILTLYYRFIPPNHCSFWHFIIFVQTKANAHTKLNH